MRIDRPIRGPGLIKCRLWYLTQHPASPFKPLLALAAPCLLCSPWVKVLERPGDEHGNRSEEVYVENPYKNKDSKDVSADVPEKVWACQCAGGRGLLCV